MAVITAQKCTHVLNTPSRRQLFTYAPVESVMWWVEGSTCSVVRERRPESRHNPGGGPLFNHSRHHCLPCLQGLCSALRHQWTDPTIGWRASRRVAASPCRGVGVRAHVSACDPVRPPHAATAALGAIILCIEIDACSESKDKYQGSDPG